MVKKLFKHEFRSYVRIMGVLYIVLVTSACFCLVLRVLESDTAVFRIVDALSSATYKVSSFASVAGSFVLGIIRFYRNLFTAEGYLTHTLPVTASQHIVVKAVTAAAMNWLTWLIAFLASYIATGGEILDALLLVIHHVSWSLQWIGVHGAVFWIEVVILLLVATVSGILQYYTFICIGQLFRKHRILGAVGAYFAYYILSQVLVTVLTVLVATSTFAGLLDGLFWWLHSNPAAAVHLTIWVAIIMAAGFAAIKFAVVRFILTKKLNLE